MSKLPDSEALATLIARRDDATQLTPDDPLCAIIALVRALGAARIDIQVMPAGHAAVEVTFDTREAAAALADRLRMGPLEHASNDRNEWWHAQRGDYGFERLLIVGGHRPLCACGAQGRAA